MTVAALFVDMDGCYANRPDVEVWDVTRDARTYPGPHPVVAHPPCESWGRFYWRTGRTCGADAGCMEAAVAAVQRWGGVLEHPAHSPAFLAHLIPRPRPGVGWQPALFRGGWVCEVFQGAYGHRAPKRTWLYYVGPPPFALDWRAVDPGGRVERMPGDGKRRRATPDAFAAVLLRLAAHASYRPSL